MRAVRKLLLLSLMLVYTLQGLAALAAPCPHREAPVAPVSAGSPMPVMAHAGHAVAVDALAGASVRAHGDCCATTRCDASHCQAVVGLPCSGFDGARPAPAPAPAACQASFLSHPTESPFRPPISL